MFSDVADLLLNRTVMIIGFQRFKITEAEFYVNDYKHHLDTFATSSRITTEHSKGQWLVRVRTKGAHSTLEITIGEAL